MSEHGQLDPVEKLRPLRSPVVSFSTGVNDRNSPSLATDNFLAQDQARIDDELPDFQRHSEPTLLELFFDLFFAASYDVFSDTQDVTSVDRFGAFVGYFCLMWLTWFVVTLFDVRYVTDSIFSRVTRAIHLGVMVGFAVVTPRYDPTKQHPETMQTMSLILMISRLCLTIDSAYWVWYILSGVETCFSLLLSASSPALSLSKTHLMKRMTVMTIMIMGDGIIKMATDVVTLVRNQSAWNDISIGLVTGASATFYFVFLIYFDWIRSTFCLPTWRQLVWTVTHLPFHLALIMFSKGFTQLIIWTRIVNYIEQQGQTIRSYQSWPGLTSREITDQLNASTRQFLHDFPPKIQDTWATVDEALVNISRLPDWVWIAPDLQPNGTVNQLSDDEADRFAACIPIIFICQANALLATYNINFDLESQPASHLADAPGTELAEAKGSMYQAQILRKASDRYSLVFCYSYIATGITLFLMAILAVVVRTPPRKAWPLIRLTVILLLALATGLTALLFLRADGEFISSAWITPPITLVWTLVLLMTHINGEGVRRNAHLFQRRKPPYDMAATSVPLNAPTPAASCADGVRDDATQGSSQSLPQDRYRPATAKQLDGWDSRSNGWT
ncbi:hypothetical protein CDD83_2003 [Cordyceps sp. RAO-2017]|nr:hypothetical protein CDD83_2003 [Cordyceps sp. RAO-2017]